MSVQSRGPAVNHRNVNLDQLRERMQSSGASTAVKSGLVQTPVDDESLSEYNE